MATRYGPVIGPNIGSSGQPVTAYGAHNFQRSYYRSNQTSGVGIRAHYEDLEFKGTIGGEVLRLRGIANGLLCATGSTINAIHATGRVEAAKTVSGALNAIRATLEVAGSTPTPGGTLAALQLDSNIVTGWTSSGVDSFIRITQSGVGKINRLMNIPAPVSYDSTSLFVSSADKAATHMIRFCSDAGVTYWLLATTNAPA